MSFRHTAVITTDAITLSIVKNGATFVTSTTLNAANQGRFLDFKTLSNTINSANFLFEAGDRFTMQISTGASFAPTGGHVIGQVLVRYL
jgi:hypothetical protein